MQYVIARLYSSYIPAAVGTKSKSGEPVVDSMSTRPSNTGDWKN